MNSKNKGKVGERQAAKRIRELFGTEAKRSQQNCGAAGDADLSPDSIPGFHVEVKFIGTIAAYAKLEQFDALLSKSGGTAALDYLRQATDDAKGRTPVVMLRHNGSKRWAFLLWDTDFRDLIHAAQGATTGTEAEAITPA